MSSLENTPLAVQASPQEAEWWLPRHQQKLLEKSAMGQVDLVFLGDSITQAWEDLGQPVWQQYYGHRKALNLGFNGDRTEHVLWRLEQGELDGIQPKVVVLLIGTNNTGHRQDPAEQTAQGIERIVGVLKEKLPHTKILLLGILPRSAKPSQRLRLINEDINRLIKPFADNQQVFFLDFGHLFLDAQGKLSEVIMPDLLHPSAPQYQVWAEQIEGFLAENL